MKNLIIISLRPLAYALFSAILAWLLPAGSEKLLTILLTFFGSAFLVQTTKDVIIPPK